MRKIAKFYFIILLIKCAIKIVQKDILEIKQHIAARFVLIIKTSALKTKSIQLAVHYKHKIKTNNNKNK
jgi:hypothetical protein